MKKKKAKSIKKVSKKKSQKSGKGFSSWIPFLVGVLILAADQLTKYLVHSNIPRMTHETQWYPYNGLGIVESFFGIEFSIVHTINLGAAWGMFSGFQFPLLVLRVVLIMGLCLYLILYNKNKALIVPFVFVIVGAIGNILDFFVYGHVVDMIHFVFLGYDYPVFNIADSFICIGVALLFIIPWCQTKGYIACKQ